MNTFRFKLLIVAMLLLGVILVRLTRKDLQSKYRYDKIAMLARFVGKEYCSCRFVVLQSDEYCRNYVSAEIPIFGFRINTSNVTQIKVRKPKPEEPYTQVVESSAFLAVRATTVFESGKGCRLLP